VDLLYAMCDKSNSEEIVSEMLSYLETADYSIREEMVLKVAILAEKYASDYTWYVDVILNLIRIAGDYVSEEVWYRVIQIVINREDVQGYAAKTVFEVSDYYGRNCLTQTLIDCCDTTGTASAGVSREYGESGRLYTGRVWKPNSR
jgi:hypothetical protein